MNITELDKARFWIKVTQTDYCWEWTGSLNKQGYGTFRLNGESLAHRIAYKIIHGDIFNSLNVCHKCDNTKCVNPSHLFTGTQSDNMIDKMKKKRHRMFGRASKYNGVTWRNDSKKWRAIVTFKGNKIHIGCFENEIDAAKAYDKFIYEKYKSKEMLNFP